VIRARDPKLDRLVALKLCRVGSPEAAQRLVCEARALAKLSHPNIVTIHDLNDDGDRVFLVMELIEDGDTLAALIAERPPWEVIVDALREAGRGLAAAHREAITHGDFKPDNVLDAHGRPRVADFGLARVWLEHEHEPGAREQLRRRTGTLGYMAPEVLDGQACTPKADQFSFCVTMLQALNHGALPFPGYRSEAVLHAIKNNPLPEIKQAVPSALRKIVKRGLSIDPSKRFANMDELLAALDRVRAPSSGGRTTGWIAFGVALGSTLAGGLALIVLGPASDATASVDVELPEPSKVSEPIELPYPHNLVSPCAMDEEVSIADEELLKTCTQIRNGQLESAQTGWEHERNRRLSGDRVALVEATLIVARTFVDHAVVTQHAGPEDAREAARRGNTWARYAANLIDPHEGLNDPRVSPILTRVKPLLPR
jgi:serine/threonine protein kinase